MKIEYAPAPNRGITQLAYVGDDGTAAALAPRKPMPFVKIGIAALVGYALYRLLTR